MCCERELSLRYALGASGVFHSLRFSYTERMAGSTLLSILGGILLLGGLVGIVLPVLPAVPLAWLGFALFALATDFANVSLFTVLVFLALSLLTIAFDVALPVYGAKRFNASKLALLGAGLGVIVGIVFLGPIGIIAGPLVGAIAGEVLSGKEWRESIRASAGVVAGILTNLVLKVVLILTMVGFCVVALFSWTL
jgi:uncharacterized protein